MSEHTKTPWSFRRIEARDYGECQYSLTHNGDPFVCVGTCITREKDARHIVHCVNNHERLVEALKECMAEVLDLEKESSIENGKESKLEDMPDCYNKARTLLASLKAEKGGEL